MAIKQQVEAIFNSNKNLTDRFPKIQNVNYFDLHNKHLFYGRIDKDCDAVLLDEQGNLASIYTGGSDTEWAIDFVAAAFEDMRAYYTKLVNTGDLDPFSAYGRELLVRKCTRAGDFKFSYDNYILSKVYTNFVDEYLSLERRHEKIKNFYDFVKIFMQYITRVAKYFPITKTGYVLSDKCSPLNSGLILEIANEQHGTSNNANIFKYAGGEDANFETFVKMAKKFGFMVDKNAPWRIVFNLGSGELTRREGQGLAGAQKYMDQYGVSYENIFQIYFRKTHLEELQNIKETLRILYLAFYEQYSTYEKLTYEVNVVGEDCRAVRTKLLRADREPYPIIFGPVDKVDEYYLKIILKLRMVESGTPHNDKNFLFYMKKLIKQKRLYSNEAALNYINHLTKGMPELKFIKKGKYWHGTTAAKYSQRRQEAKEKLDNPDSVNYSISGTKSGG